MNQNDRDLMTRVYRILERYETPPHGLSDAESDDYFQRVAGDCQKLCDDFKQSVLAMPFACAVFQSVEKRYLAAKGAQE